tara:strand:+ start:388 stop:798 length:411 start_codon:yes stop_codon:yes gene_type:complete
MSWEILPTEICVYILKIRNNIRNNASKKIQNAWRNYILKDCLAIDFALLIESDQYNEIIISIPSTTIILKYCLSMCTGKFYLAFWKKIAKQLYTSLKLYEYPDNEWITPEAVNYRKIKIQYNKLLEKFNFKHFHEF